MIDYAIHNKCRDCDGGGFFFFFHFSLRKNGAKGIDSVSGKRERRDICEIPLHMSGGGGGRGRRGGRAARVGGKMEMEMEMGLQQNVRLRTHMQNSP